MLPCVFYASMLFYVGASGGLYSLIYINNLQSLVIIFCALDTTLRIMNTWYRLHVILILWSPFYSERLYTACFQADLIHREKKWRLLWTLSCTYPLSHHGWMLVCLFKTNKPNKATLDFATLRFSTTLNCKCLGLSTSCFRLSTHIIKLYSYSHSSKKRWTLTLINIHRMRTRTSRFSR